MEVDDPICSLARDNDDDGGRSLKMIQFPALLVSASLCFYAYKMKIIIADADDLFVIY